MRAGNVRSVPREIAEDLGKRQRSQKNASPEIVGDRRANLRRRSIGHVDSVKSAAAHFATENLDIDVPRGKDARVVSGDRHIVGAQE